MHPKDTNTPSENIFPNAFQLFLHLTEIESRFDLRIWVLVPSLQDWCWSQEIKDHKQCTAQAYQPISFQRFWISLLWLEMG